MRLLLPLLTLLLAFPAGANTLDEVKAALEKFAGRQPVRATYSLESNMKASGRFANQHDRNSLSVEVLHDADGVHIIVPQPLIDKARASGDGSVERPTQGTLGSVSVPDIVEALDYRQSLLNMLKRGTVREEKSVDYRGKPARLLLVKLTKPPQEENSIQIGKLKYEGELSLWVGENNLPLSAEVVEKTKGGFLMFNAETTGRSRYTFAQTGDRIVLTRFETSGSGGGMGQKFEATSVQIVALR